VCLYDNQSDQEEYIDLSTDRREHEIYNAGFDYFRANLILSKHKLNPALSFCRLCKFSVRTWTLDEHFKRFAHRVNSNKMVYKYVSIDYKTK